MITKIFTCFSSGYNKKDDAINAAESSCSQLAYEFIEKKGKGSLFSKKLDLVIFNEKVVKSYSQKKGSVYDGYASVTFTFCDREYKKQFDNQKDDKEQQNRFLNLIEDNGVDKVNELMDKFISLGARPMIEKKD